MKKKMLVLALAGIMAVSTLTGCKSIKTVDSEEVLMTVNGEEVAAGVANFYARYTQAQYETYYGAYMGEGMWGTEVEEGLTYEQEVKDTVLEMVQIMVLSEQHMEEYGVELTDADKDRIAQAVQEFTEANSQDIKDKVSGDEATVERLMTLQVITQKVQTAISDTVDKKVTDKEAAQKKMEYVHIPYVSYDENSNQITLTDEEKATEKAKVEAIKEAVAAGEDFTKATENQALAINELTFDAETTSLEEEVIAAADKLKKGEYTDVIETEEGVYLVKVVSLLDREATDAKKETILAERKSDKYVEICDKWVAESEIEVNEEVWAKVDFNELSVTYKQEEVEEEAATEETTEE